MRANVLALVVVVVSMGTSAQLSADVLPPGYRIEPVARGLDTPGAVAVAPDGRLFYLERTTGRVRIVRDGRVVEPPFLTLPVAQGAEEGLLGIALHPQFPQNGFVYLYYTQASPHTNRILRTTAAGDRATNPRVILDDIGAAANGEDNGGGLAFGADGKLYAGIGVLAEDFKAGDPAYLNGKVLRMNDDGSVPADNPFVGTPGAQPLVWASGLRNPAALALHAATGTLYVTDNYDDEPGAGCDEVNVVRRGLDYGWDGALDTCTTPGPPPAPMQDLVPPVEASGLVSYAGSAFPATCSNRAAWMCSGDADCNACENRPGQSCASDADCKACSNNPSRICFTDDGTDCGTCKKDPEIECIVDFQCGSNGPCVPSPCEANACKSNRCLPVVNDLFVAGAAGRTARDVLDEPDYDRLASSETFYDPAAAAACPDAIRGLGEGGDGWLYAAAIDADPARRGLWRIVHGDPSAAGPGPREVSASPHLRLTLRRQAGGAVTLSWEDLGHGAWGCTDGHCPPGAHAAPYTVWSGALAEPFTYAHQVLAEPAGQREADALVSYTEPQPSPASEYFLVSARAANFEGTLGRASNGSPRPGFAVRDLCTTIGHGTPAADLDRCAGEWTHAYPDQYNRMRKLSEFRGKVAYLSLVSDG
ncbi:MAG: PQQ-dependent sugar dehydrogenase [Acidobacteria bacterium]|nr:PQQ-dependent sugar dehydrogenase [Acidobacteriota bacterium]